MAENRKIYLKKLERQLIFYKYFGSPCVKERKKALSLYGIPVSTIYKDMKDLTDAGLINLVFDSVKEEYVCNNQEHVYDAGLDKPNRRKHLKRLRRLGICMRELCNDPAEVGYDENNRSYIKKGAKSCKDYYHELFPEESVRTMQRDFQVLTRIGYPIRYNRELQRYDFYDDRDYDWECPYIAGIYREAETGKLCRICGGENDLEMQYNYIEEVRGMRQGLPEEEWVTW